MTDFFMRPATRIAFEYQKDELERVRKERAKRLAEGRKEVERIANAPKGARVVVNILPAKRAMIERDAEAGFTTVSLAKMYGLTVAEINQVLRDIE